jgi:hypothetical protein
MQEQEALRRSSAYVVFHKLMQSTRLYLHDCTAVPPLAVILFGPSVQIQFHKSKSDCRVYVGSGGWIEIPHISELHAVVLKKVHALIESVLVSKLQYHQQAPPPRQGITASNRTKDDGVCTKQMLVLHVLETLLSIPSLRY